MNQQTGRMPNRLGLGINVFNALKVHPGILERVKYGGSTANPASVTENVLLMATIRTTAGEKKEITTVPPL